MVSKMGPTKGTLEMCFLSWSGWSLIPNMPFNMNKCSHNLWVPELGQQKPRELPVNCPIRKQANSWQWTTSCLVGSGLSQRMAASNIVCCQSILGVQLRSFMGVYIYIIIINHIYIYIALVIARVSWDRAPIILVIYEFKTMFNLKCTPSTRRRTWVDASGTVTTKQFQYEPGSCVLWVVHNMFQGSKHKHGQSSLGWEFKS